MWLDMSARNCSRLPPPVRWASGITCWWRIMLGSLLISRYDCLMIGVMVSSLPSSGFSPVFHSMQELAFFTTCHALVYHRLHSAFDLLRTFNLYVRTYVCAYERMYICTYLCMYACMFVRVYVCTIYVCTYVLFTYVCMYVCTYVCMFLLTSLADVS